MSDESLGSAVFKVQMSGLAEVARGFDDMGKQLDVLVQMDKRLQAASDATTGKLIEETRALKLMRVALHDTTVATTVLPNEIESMSMKSSRALGRLEIALDSLNHGFGRMERFVPSLVASLGGSGGLLIGVTGLAAAAHALYTNWDTIVEAFGGTEAKFPKMKEGIEGLTETIRDLGKEIDELKKKMEEPVKILGIESGKQPGHVDEDRLRRLEHMNKEAKENLQIEKDVEGLKKTTESEEVGSAFRKAVKDLPEGGDTLKDALIKGGMTPAQADKAMSEASRGQAGYLNDILSALPQGPGGKFEGLFGAHPEARKAQKEAEERAKEEETEKKVAENKKKAELKLNEELNREGERIERHMLEQQKRERIQDLEDQKQAIHEGLRADLDAIPKRHTQILQGAKSAIDMYQTAKDDKANRLRKEAADRLKSIDESLKKERRLVLGN